MTATDPCAWAARSNSPPPLLNLLLPTHHHHQSTLLDLHRTSGSLILGYRYPSQDLQESAYSSKGFGRWRTIHRSILGVITGLLTALIDPCRRYVTFHLQQDASHPFYPRRGHLLISQGQFLREYRLVVVGGGGKLQLGPVSISSV